MGLVARRLAASFGLQRGKRDRIAENRRGKMTAVGVLVLIKYGRNHFIFMPLAGSRGPALGLSHTRAIFNSRISESWIGSWVGNFGSVPLSSLE